MECPICFEEKKDYIACMSCDQNICNKCFEKIQNNPCPFCRQNFFIDCFQSAYKSKFVEFEDIIKKIEIPIKNFTSFDITLKPFDQKGKIVLFENNKQLNKILNELSSIKEYIIIPTYTYRHNNINGIIVEHIISYNKKLVSLSYVGKLEFIINLIVTIRNINKKQHHCLKYISKESICIVGRNRIALDISGIRIPIINENESNNLNLVLQGICDKKYIINMIMELIKEIVLNYDFPDKLDYFPHMLESIIKFNNDEILSKQLKTYFDIIAKLRKYLIENYNMTDKFSIFVKTQTGKKYNLDVYPNMYIIKLKEFVKDKIGIPVCEQRLIFDGMSLDDNNLLRDYNLEEDSVVHLILRLCGGKPVIIFKNYPSNFVINEVKLSLDNNIWNIDITNPNIDIWKNIIVESNEGIRIENQQYRNLFWDALTNSNDIFFQKFNTNSNMIWISMEDFPSVIRKIMLQNGFNDYDVQDFITYWQWQLQYKYIGLSVHINEEWYNDIAKLEIHPKPKNIIRMFIIFNLSNNNYQNSFDNFIDINHVQIIPGKELLSETVLEWGGIILK